MDHLELGQRGEVLAAAYLMRQGFEIRERNYRWRRAEVDLIAFRQNRLHFVEVKTRSWRDVDLARGAVDRRKESFIIGAAAEYMHVQNWEGDFQFDVIVVLVDGRGGQELTYISDAFGFEE